MTDDGLSDEEKVMVGKLARQLKIPRAEARQFYCKQREARRNG